MHHARIVKRDIIALFKHYPTKEAVYKYIGFNDRHRIEKLQEETTNAIPDDLSESELQKYHEKILLENTNLHLSQCDLM